MSTNIQIIDGKLREVEHASVSDRTAVPPLSDCCDFLSAATLAALANVFRISEDDVLDALVAERKLEDQRKTE